jgi:hypothetical protein
MCVQSLAWWGNRLLILGSATKSLKFAVLLVYKQAITRTALHLKRKSEK